jgi:hypothetical protein
VGNIGHPFALEDASFGGAEEDVGVQRSLLAAACDRSNEILDIQFRQWLSVHGDYMCE